MVSPRDIRDVTNVLKEGIRRPWALAIVPEYADPLGYYNGGVEKYVDMNDRSARGWRRQVKRAKRFGARLSFHGLTHQYGRVPNPYNGVSGDDFEFWNAVDDEPVAEDSYEWVEDRVLTAQAHMDRRRWTAHAFQTPHYRSSALDYMIMADWYANGYHRVVYYPYEVDLWGDVYTWNEIWNDPQAIADWSAANVSIAGDQWGGQFFPYVIERDVYGQRMIPENLGNIEPVEFALGPQYARTVPDLLAAADANLVNRCAFASFFYHPYLMQFPELEDAGGKQALRDLVLGIEAMGYEFVAFEQL